MNDSDYIRLVEDIYVSQVLVLAAQIKAQKKSKGVTSTSDFVSDAVRLIDQNRDRILRERSSIR